MRLAAANDGVAVFVRAAFACVARQDVVVSAPMATRRQTVAERAAVSAPPGVRAHTHRARIATSGRAAGRTARRRSSERASVAMPAPKSREIQRKQLAADERRRRGVAHEPWHFRLVHAAEGRAHFAARRVGGGGETPRRRANRR